jgi:hypothetical protein
MIFSMVGLITTKRVEEIKGGKTGEERGNKGRERERERERVERERVPRE